MKTTLLKRLMGGSVILASVLGLSACSSTGQYTNQYATARMQQHGVMLDNAAAQVLAARFAATFDQMGKPEFLGAVNELYADNLYMNDTLSLAQQKSALLDNFKDMNKRIKRAKVDIINVNASQDSAYIHWKMTFHLKFLGQEKDIASYGISEIKQNAAGQIIFQHDFWDPANGLYRPLPYVGGLFRWLVPFKVH